METKVCSICETEKPLDDFAWKNREKRKVSSDCKVCHRVIRKQYYDDNTDKEKERVKDRKDKLREWYKERKSELKCEKCGEGHISTIQFHHTDSTKKEIALSAAVNRGYSIKRMENEIKKCVVVCANCHFKLHYVG